MHTQMVPRRVPHEIARRVMRASLPTPPTERVQTIAEAIFRNGAVLVRENSPPVLVGDFRWAEPNVVLAFPAFGDRKSDATAFAFHYARADESSVTFRHSGGSELSLLSIDRAQVSDPDDYRVAWQLWQHVAPLQIRLIEAAYEDLAARS